MPKKKTKYKKTFIIICIIFSLLFIIPSSALDWSIMKNWWELTGSSGITGEFTGDYDLNTSGNIIASNLSGSISTSNIDRDIAANCSINTYQIGNGINMSIRICSSITSAAINGTIWNISGNNIFPSDLDYNVGIGTNNPTEKFDVAGGVKVAGNISNVSKIVGSNESYISFESNGDVGVWI